MYTPDDDQDRAGRIIAIYWSEMFFAVIIVSLRMYSRKMTRTTGLDDWLMLGGLVMHLILSAFTTYYAVLGGCRHLDSLTADQQKEVLLWEYILQFWIIIAFILPRMSVAILINRIMKPLRGWRYWTLVVSIVIMIILNVLDALFTYLQCDPVDALWDKSITDANCWRPSIQPNFAITQASFSVYIDVLLAVIPATIVYNLNIEMRKRLGLMVLLGLGLSAAAAAIVKTSCLAGLSQHSDLTWSSYELNVWAGTENWLVIMCGSVPPLKPLWDRALSKRKRKPGLPLTKSTGSTFTGSDILAEHELRNDPFKPRPPSESLTTSSVEPVGGAFPRHFVV